MDDYALMNRHIFSNGRLQGVVILRSASGISENPPPSAPDDG
jgi:hypothetical protein